MNSIDVESLAIIDRAISNNRFSPAEYEIIRRTIFRTADFDYYSLLHFSESALHQGQIALSDHKSIVVDVPSVQAEIAPLLYETFLNPVYCCRNVNIKPKPGENIYSLGLQALAKEHPDAIYVVAQEQTALNTLVKLIQKEVIKPSLVIVTAPIFVSHSNQEWLINSFIPNICLNGDKGGISVALSIIKSLINLVWYENQNSVGDGETGRLGGKR